MEQNITVEQFWEVKQVDLIEKVGYVIFGDEEFAESITIGVMIEILETEYASVMCTSLFGNWKVYLIKVDSNNDFKSDSEYKAMELVDALWKAVKDIF